MPCNSEYMNANETEIMLSRVLCLLDEVNGKTWTKDAWLGYHPEAYNKATKENLDKSTQKLCHLLGGKDESEIARYSLELQMWWRDHKRADEERVNKEIKEAADEEARKAALEKLTPYERKLLKVR